jgi:predicted TIM-barrel fold metal-dependent hydrolase
MIIDTHTHIAPDKIANIVANIMKEHGYPLYGAMTITGLLSNMQNLGIDVSVTFCVADKPTGVKPSNEFVVNACNNKKLLGLGTIHPDFEDYVNEIKRLRDNGIKGIKFNSLVQFFYPDEERMFPIYQALEDDIVLFHAGVDPARPDAPVHATPERIAKVVKAFPKLKVVAAHYGGLGMLEEVKKHLVGKNLYLDTAWDVSLGELDPDQIAQIIIEHGSHRVLFGSDYPFIETKKELEWILKLPLSDEDKERILWKNAAELFGMKP